MSAEKIIEQIKKDASKQIEQIRKKSDEQAKEIITSAKQEAQEQSKKIEKKGIKQAQNYKKILISQANQESNRKQMDAREDIINNCFTKAEEKLSNLSEEDYRKIVDLLVKKGSQEIAGEKRLFISRDTDKKIAEKHGIPVAGKISSMGGILISSKNEKITIDNTFEGILKREKPEIRNKVGKLLFS